MSMSKEDTEEEQCGSSATSSIPLNSGCLAELSLSSYDKYLHTHFKNVCGVCDGGSSAYHDDKNFPYSLSNIKLENVCHANTHTHDIDRKKGLSVIISMYKCYEYHKKNLMEI